MITIQKLKNESLEIFNKKRVVIYGINCYPLDLYFILKKLDINVLACCVENKNKTAHMKARLRGIPIIDMHKLERFAHKYDNLIIQSYDFDATKINLIKQNAKKLNLDFSEISSGEIIATYGSGKVIDKIRNLVFFKIRHFRWKKACKRKQTSDFSLFLKNNPRNPIIICSPPKTADKSLVETFESLHTVMDYAYLSHLSRLLDIPYCEKRLGVVRIIMGVREPISQNLSRLYQELSSGQDEFNWIMGDLDGKNTKERKKIIAEYEELFITNGDNVQMLWEKFIQRYVYPEDGIKKMSYEPKAVSTFLMEFKEYVLDILDYPFNKEEGFTIIKEGNIEVFIYQLEKLNAVVPQLSEWVGVPFDKLENSNVASDKWVGASYKQALKEIEITQEYFDKCFTEPYVQHCYSETDIEKFKARWRPHIKK